MYLTDIRDGLISDMLSAPAGWKVQIEWTQTGTWTVQVGLVPETKTFILDGIPNPQWSG